MIFYENEIKRMNVWEKVVQVSNEVGFVSSSVEQAKIEIAEGMAKFGLVLFQVSENMHKLVNIHDASECIEVVGETRDKTLLELFNINIIKQTVNVVEPKQEPKQEAKSFTPNTRFNVANTPQEAVARVNEVAQANNSNVTTVSDIFTEKFNEQLRKANEGQRADNKKMIDIIGKSKALGFKREDFKNVMFMALGVELETQVSQAQADMIYDALTWHLKKLGIPTKN